MKSKLGILVFAVLFALFSMNAAAFASSAGTQTTEATVSFEDGELQFDDETLGASMLNMDIDFGLHKLPTTAVTYEAEDGSHTLRVSDARTDAGGWEITVEVSEFVRADDPSEVFDGVVTLKNGAISSVLGNNSPLASAFSVANATLDIESRQNAILVAWTESSLERDSFDVTWQQSDVTLSLDATNAQKVELNTSGATAYKADMTWTLLIP